MLKEGFPLLPFPTDVDANRPLNSDQPVAIPLAPGEPLDLEATLRCGQAFRWRQGGEWWYGAHGATALALRHAEGQLTARALGAPTTVGAVWRFLGLDHSLLAVKERLSGDAWVAKAMAAAPGMRLLRQDPWECTLGFICSQNSNIPKIERSLERLARSYGSMLQWPEGVEAAVLPTPSRLADLPCDDLRSTALGYRCRYLVGSAHRVAQGVPDLAALRSSTYEEALQGLLELPGVGRKVADCILLFSMDQPQAFPVDVWVRRVVHELYPRELAAWMPDAPSRLSGTLTPREYEAMVRFARDRWGGLAGYAQQYLFHARRTGKLESADPPVSDR